MAMISRLQRNIKHVVVLMLENRSADNLIGWLYDDKTTPDHFFPTGSPKSYNGLHGANYGNPLNLSDPSTFIKATKGVSNFQVPNPDPNEYFKNMNQQLFGLDIDKSTKGWLPCPEYCKANMQGFLYDYSTAKHSSKKIAPQIMGTYTSKNLSLMSGLAKSYAVSDNYHASCPTQTLPNRSFMHAGTSLGRVNNYPYLPYAVPTIFNAFEDAGYSWGVYNPSEIIPSLTLMQMTHLWDPLLEGRFHSVSQFIKDCASGSLPDYSFLEPSFFFDIGTAPTSEHPPFNVCAGDHYLEVIWQAISSSPAFSETLFIVNFDEHGGCPDHVPPNWTAIAPDAKSKPGNLGFKFNRYGVRVPAIFVSPHIRSKTVFRASEDPWSDESRPYDHTSILAMLLDWKNIPRSALKSERVNSEPKHPFDELIENDCRTDVPVLAASCHLNTPTDVGCLTSLQKSIIVLALAYFRWHSGATTSADPRMEQKAIADLLSGVKTEADVIKYFEQLKHI